MLDWKMKQPDRTKGWNLVDESGKVLDSLSYDFDLMVYRDSRGESIGKTWADATSALESRANRESAEPMKRKGKRS